MNFQLLESLYLKLRVEKKVKSQEAFGAALGYGKSFTSKIMRGVEKIPDDIYDKILSVYGESAVSYLNKNDHETIFSIPKLEVVTSGNAIEKLITSISDLVSEIRLDRKEIKEEIKKLSASSDRIEQKLENDQKVSDNKFGFLVDQLSQVSGLSKEEIQKGLNNAATGSST